MPVPLWSSQLQRSTLLTLCLQHSCESCGKGNIFFYKENQGSSCSLLGMYGRIKSMSCVYQLSTNTWALRLPDQFFRGRNCTAIDFRILSVISKFICLQFVSLQNLVIIVSALYLSVKIYTSLPNEYLYRKIIISSLLHRYKTERYSCYFDNPEHEQFFFSCNHVTCLGIKTWINYTLMQIWCFWVEKSALNSESCSKMLKLVGKLWNF